MRTEELVRYDAALSLVSEIDQNLGAGISHYTSRGRPIPTYRDRSGRLLFTLDQVVRAILADDLMPFQEAIHGKAI